MGSSWKNIYLTYHGRIFLAVNCNINKKNKNIFKRHLYFEGVCCKIDNAFMSKDLNFNTFREEDS